MLRPCHGVVIPHRTGAVLHIGKVVFALHGRAAIQAVEDHRDLDADSVAIRLKSGRAGASHQAVFIDEHHIAIEPIACGNVGKGICACVRVVLRPASVNRLVPVQLDFRDFVCQSCVGIPAAKVVAVMGRGIAGKVNGLAVGRADRLNTAAAVCFKGQLVVGSAAALAAGAVPAACTFPICGNRNSLDRHGKGCCRTACVGKVHAVVRSPAGECVAAARSRADCDGIARRIAARSACRRITVVDGHGINGQVIVELQGQDVI